MSSSTILRLVFITIGLQAVSLVNTETPSRSKIAVELTAEEQRAVKQFRVLVGDLLKEDYMKTDHYLIRWIRDKNLNLSEANLKFRKYLQYRKDNSLDSITKENMSELRKGFPFWIDGHDTEGRPLLTWPFGSSWDVRRAVIAGQAARLSRYVDYMIESTAIVARKSRSKVTGESLSQAVAIMDLNGYNLRQHACLLCLPFYSELIAKLENNYPQGLQSFNIINAPRIFSRLFETLLPLASPATQSVVRVFGHDKTEWRAAFLKTIDMSELRPQFGGTKVV